MTSFSRSIPVLSVILALSTAAAVFEILQENWLRVQRSSWLDGELDLSDLTLDDLPS